MTHRKEDDVRNVLFNEMNRPFTAYALDDMERWDALIRVRDGVNAALEKARADKRIGKSLEAKVTLVKDSDENHPPRAFDDEKLAELFIVSEVEVTDDAARYAEGAETLVAGVRVLVAPAEGDKCPRCWRQVKTHGPDGLCPRCVRVVSLLK